MNRLVLLLLTCYKKAISPLVPRACRFYPSCSDYAREAVSRHGAVRGLWLSAYRLLRCNPYNPGGYDPVPGAREPVERHEGMNVESG